MTEVAERPDLADYRRATVSALIERVGAGAIDRDERDEPPVDAIAEIKRARLGALRVPTELGGGGYGLVDVFRVFIELGAADSNVAHILRSHYGVVENLRLSAEARGDDSAERRALARTWLARVADGELIGSASTELTAKAGAQGYAYETAVTETPSGLRLNGTKHYTTGSKYMDWLIVAATDVDGSTVSLIIPTDRPGVTAPDDWDGFGQRFTASGTVRFEDVAVEPDDYFGPGGFPRDNLPYPATFFHVQLNAMIAGILRQVTADAARVVRDRPRSFYHATSDVPAQDPVFHLTVGQIASQAFAAESLVLTAASALAEAYDAHGTDREPELSLGAALFNAKSKVVIDELANRASSELFDVGGGSLVRRSAHLDRHWRNIRSIAAHNPKTLKAVAVGRYEINGTPLPNQGFF
ncbi:acyl-CoA dehydrogenase family protein [Gordonia sp. ABSL1-1]|uniref:acyl-CoA dehydrogenase family protein n=1 Tax=Gordonia sp. ABSL1-1 TaxID=3053923 RepID=UPI002573C824|nr:acyl-CoA dehydrogenase family protein [Gordonia sp. ABSL1-1]MDL9937800.1 acyl-CoA dehydrogenase family protein [Gordonia sp. ABSL1-1]